MKLDVVAIGLLNVDMIIRGNAPPVMNELLSWTGESQIECLTAGSVGYLVQNLARLGLKTGVIATIADDAFGSIIKKTITDAGVDISRLRIQKNTKSAIGVFMLLFGNKKRPMTFRFMTHDLIPTFSDEDLEYIYNSRLLHVGGYLHFPRKQIFEELIQKTSAQGVKISIDSQFPLKTLEKPWINAMPDLKNVDVLLMDENEAFGLTNAENVDEAVAKLIEYGAKIVAVKLGTQGCLVGDQNEVIRKSALPVDNVVDSIGAGDSFDCGFITGFLEGLSLERTIKLALTVASHSLTGVGGSNSIPRRDEIVF